MPFNSHTLSTDPRTIKLVQLAARNLRNVHTLRIIVGHPTLTDALLRCFFDASRTNDPEIVPVRRLWLENCRISIGLDMRMDEHPYGLPLTCDFQGLEAARFRRLPMRPGLPFSNIAPRFHYTYSRGGTAIEMNDGLGGTFSTTMNDIDTEIRAGEDHCVWLEDKRNRPSAFDPSPLQVFYDVPHAFDDRIYESLADAGLPEEVLRLSSMTRYDRAVQAYRGTWLDPSHIYPSPGQVSPSFDFKSQVLTRTATWKKMQRERIPSADAAMAMLNNASATMTSLNLDWILTIPPTLGHSKDKDAFLSWCKMFLALFRCRFPHLRSFQVRNCVVPETRLPTGLYLLDHSSPYHGDPHNGSVARIFDSEVSSAMDLAGLEFMEAHTNLKCLAWPMDHFFGPKDLQGDIKERVEKVVDNLGRTLTGLRVDTLYAGPTNDEPQSEEVHCTNIGMKVFEQP